MKFESPAFFSWIFGIICLCVLQTACKEVQEEVDLIVKNVAVYSIPETASKKVHVLVKEGKILNLLEADANLPPSKELIDGQGLYATAGFWNLHVHFSHPKWFNASQAQADSLQAALDEMLNSYGFTTVLDIGSDLKNTFEIRNRIASGELRGPRILSAGSGFVIKGGSPAYLEVKLPEFLSADDARNQVFENIQAGADHIKLFTGSFLGVGKVAVIPPEIAKAAVEEAHTHGRLVTAHPQSLEGLESAVYAHVDMLAHTAPDAGKLSDSLLQEMAAKDIVLVPTLKLWRWELGRANLPDFVVDKMENSGITQVRDYLQNGGEIAFGTDVGYMSDYNTAEEFRLMGRAGMSFEQVLASLTTIPTQRVGDFSQKGTLEPGKMADMVLLSADPKANLENFSKVRYTIKEGKVVFRK